MRPFLCGFADEFEKLGTGGLGRALGRAQLRVARALTGADPRVPVPFADGPLDDAVSKLRLQQRFLELNRMQMGMEPEPDEEKTAGFGFVSPRLARRVVANSGYDDRDPAFRQMARQLTGQPDLDRMSQPQLRTLITVMTGQAL